MKKHLLRITVNGQEYELYINPKRLLVEVLRDDLDLTGTKRGCESESCGVCTVIVNDMSVKSCSLLAMQVDGMSVTTSEGLEVNGKLRPIQKAFLDYGAYQCGFCTSGMLMSATAFLEENPHPTIQEIKEGIDGNLCRCTGYNSIVRAIEAVTKGKYTEEKS